MSLGEFCFFFLFLLLQLLLPLRRYVYALLYKGGAVTQALRFHDFSWTMRLTHVGGSGAFRLFDKRTGETIEMLDLDKLLLKEQRIHLYSFPRDALMLAKQMEKELKRQGLTHVGIEPYIIVETTHLPAVRATDATTDLTEEEFRYFRRYEWDLTDQEQGKSY